MQGPANEHRVVARDFHRDALRQARLHILDGLVDALGDADGVRLRLPDDADEEIRQL